MNLNINKLREYFFALYIIAVPLCFKPDFSRGSQENFFQYMGISMVAFFVGNLWIGAFLILNVFLYVYNGSSVGFDQVLNVLFGSLIFMFSRYFFLRNKFEVVYKPLLTVAIISLTFMVFQLFHIDPLFTGMTNGGEQILGKFGDPIGFFGIKEAHGTFLTIAMPIMAAINPLLGLLFLIPIKTCQSSAVYLAAMSVVLFYSYHLHRKFFIALLVVIPILSLGFIFKDIKTDPKTFNSRFPVWHSAFMFSLKNPIGFGPDSYRNLNKHKDFKFVGDNHYNHGILHQLDENKSVFRYYSITNDPKEIEQKMARIGETSLPTGRMDEWDNPHSTYINVLFQYGIAGTILMIGLILQILKRFRKSIKSKELIVVASCLIAYAITAIAHFPIDIARTGFFFPILLGAFFAITDKKERT